MKMYLFVVYFLDSSHIFCPPRAVLDASGQLMPFDYGEDEGYTHQNVRKQQHINEQKQQQRRASAVEILPGPSPPLKQGAASPNRIMFKTAAK
jgi:hypothetical protein